MNSKLGSLKLPDFVRAAVVSGLTAIATGLYGGLTATPPHFPSGWAGTAGWEPIAILGGSAFMSVIVHALSTNSQNQFLKKDTSVTPDSTNKS